MQNSELKQAIKYFDSVVDVFNNNKKLENMSPLTIEDYDIKQLTILLKYIKEVNNV